MWCAVAIGSTFPDDYDYDINVDIVRSERRYVREFDVGSVFAFDSAVTSTTATIPEGVATVVAPTFSGNKVTVGLTAVADSQYVTVALTNINGGSGSTSVRVGFLGGDTNQNRVVTVADLGLVNSQLA